MARAQGAQGFGPVTDDRRLQPYSRRRSRPSRRGNRRRRRARRTRLHRRHDGRHDAKERVTFPDATCRSTQMTPFWWRTTSSFSFETPEGPITAVDNVSFGVQARRVPVGHRSVGLRQIDLVQCDRRPSRTAYRASSASPEKPSPVRTNRSAWCSRRSRRFPWRTVTDNVAFPLELIGMPKAKRDRARPAFHLTRRPRRF